MALSPSEKISGTNSEFFNAYIFRHIGYGFGQTCQIQSVAIPKFYLIMPKSNEDN